MTFNLFQDHEGPEGEQMYSSTLSSTSVLNGGGWPTPLPGPFTSWKEPSTHETGDWVGPRVGLDMCEKSRSRRDSIPGLFSP
jgi:hypothetical protein